MPAGKPRTGANSKPQSNRGGARPGAGRKPKAIVALRDSLIVVQPPEIGSGPDRIADYKSSTEFALWFLDATMRDECEKTQHRIDCAKEVLNRTIGRARISVAVPIDDVGDDKGGITIYIPDNGRTAQPTGTG